MRNFVSKNDFNKSSTHKSKKDYTRIKGISINFIILDELYEEYMEENWGIGEDDLNTGFKPEKAY